MVESRFLKRVAERKRQPQGACSYWLSALWTFVRVGTPDRKAYLKSDISFAKYQARQIADFLASKGPNSLDEPLSWPDEDVDSSGDQLPAFASALGMVDEWRDAAGCVSELSSILIKAMCSVDKDDPQFPDMFETLGILTYVEARIAQVLEAS